jgi:hypothetical protein
MYDPETFYPSTNFVLYPGNSDDAVSLIREAMAKL